MRFISVYKIYAVVYTTALICVYKIYAVVYTTALIL